MARNRNTRRADELEQKGPGTAAAEVQILPASASVGEQRDKGDDDTVDGLPGGVRVSNLGSDGDAAGQASKQQTLRAAEAEPAVTQAAETLPLAPDPDPVEEDITIERISGNEEGYRAMHPLNLANIDNVVKGPGFVFNATGVYRDFSNLDKIYSAAPGTIVPNGVYLVADRDLLPEPERSRAIGRRVRTLESAGFLPSLGVPTVETTPGAFRVSSLTPDANKSDKGE